MTFEVYKQDDGKVAINIGVYKSVNGDIMFDPIFYTVGVVRAGTIVELDLQYYKNSMCSIDSNDDNS